MAKKEETGMQNLIAVELCKRGCKVYREQSGLLYTPYGERIRVGVKGKSDLQGHRSQDGKAFYIETKTPIRRSYRRTKKIYRSSKKN